VLKFKQDIYMYVNMVCAILNVLHASHLVD